MRVTALVKRIFRQMLRDKRALALMMVAPLLIMTLLHYLFNGNTVKPLVGITGADASLVKQLKSKDLIIKQYNHVNNPKDTVIKDDLDALLQLKDEEFNLTLKNDDPSAAKPLQIKIQQSIAAENAKKQTEKLKTFILTVQSKLPGVPIKLDSAKAPTIQTDYVYGSKDATFFDKLGAIFIGFFVFFFVFLISGIALLKERTTGTLDRLMATPIQRRDIVFGYLLGYGIFAVIQTVIVVFFAVKVLDIMLVGSIWNVILINLTLALVALSLGILLSAFANSEFQMMQFIPIVIVPQIFFAGIFPVEGMADWLQVIAKCMPMYYGGDALQGVMYRGEGLSNISSDLFVLLGFALVFIVLNVFALKKYRKI
ncbi:ABC transporter permease [Neobacillus cucumis]|uniref:ABC transporter permease n=1 Tax=Neobacillus cucumis TaxID=1740721 RepID=UPI0018E01BC7|nr:ABC transporter permease [Neobacillus cucumis]MBI0578190.1 ABC transporter permease [Neobacillus cucumis]